MPPHLIQHLLASFSLFLFNILLSFINITLYFIILSLLSSTIQQSLPTLPASSSSLTSSSSPPSSRKPSPTSLSHYCFPPLFYSLSFHLLTVLIIPALIIWAQIRLFDEHFFQNSPRRSISFCSCYSCICKQELLQRLKRKWGADITR